MEFKLFNDVYHLNEEFRPCTKKPEGEEELSGPAHGSG
jgi:hypothetical protein